jgi:hypothetical protein
MLLDYLGISSLVAAIISLAAVSLYSHVIPEAVLFNAFYSSLAIAITSFFISRVIDIAQVISQTPNPKLQRAEQGAEVADPAHVALATSDRKVAKRTISRAA